MTYALTLKGTASWEDLTKPHWERFFQHRKYLYEKKAFIIGLDRQILEEILILIDDKYSDGAPVDGTEILPSHR